MGFLSRAGSEKIVMKQFFSVLDTEDRENHSEILLNGSFSSPTILGLNRWEWFQLWVTLNYKKEEET